MISRPEAHGLHPVGFNARHRLFAGGTGSALRPTGVAESQEEQRDDSHLVLPAPHRSPKRQPVPPALSVTPMTVLLLRIGWNSSGWRTPTGELLNREDSYVGRNGFGHEDWNFATTDLVGGRILGYVKFQPSEKRVDLRVPLDIWFYSRPPGGHRFLVGRYKNARFLSSSEREAAAAEFAASGVLDKRVDELVALDLPSVKSPQDARQHLFGGFSSNLSVLPEDIQVVQPPVELTRSLIGGREPRWLNRYSAPIVLSSAPAIPSRTTHPSRTTSKEKDPSQLSEEAYLRFTVAQMRLIKRMHNLLSIRFGEWLRTAGAADVCAEADRVDLRCNWRGAPCLFELKTTAAQSVRLALREAVGQLLEYAYYPGRRRPKHIAIVLDAEPSVEEIEWMRTLNSLMPPIEVFWLVGKGVRTAKLTNNPVAGLTE